MTENETAAPATGAATNTSASTSTANTPSAAIASAAAPAAPPASPPAAPVRKPVEQWQIEKGVHGWLVAFACTQNRWPHGRELTEAEFEAGINAAFEIAFR